MISRIGNFIHTNKTAHSKGDISMINRMIAAMLLKPELYEEVESDRSATGQGVLIVLIAGIATGIANLTIADGTLDAFLFGIASRLIGWVLLAAIISFVGTKLFPTPDTQSNWGELSRTMAFAQSPAILIIFGVIGLLAGLENIFWIVAFVTLVWQMAATIIAVRQALDYTSTIRAVGVTVLSYIPYAVIMTLLAQLLSEGA